MEALDYDYIGTLVVRAQHGDSDAFAELYAATYQKSYSYACRSLRDPDLAQDALQEIYIIVFRKISTLHDPKLFVSWLGQITNRVCVAMYKKNQQAAAASEDIPEGMEIEDISPGPETSLEEKDEKSYLMRQVEHLPPDISEVIKCYYYRDMKIDEIAKRTGVSRSTVKRQLAEGKKLLKNLL